jgi:hypothetical protein
MKVMSRQSRGLSVKPAFTLPKNSSNAGRRSGRAVQQAVAAMTKPNLAFSCA